MSLITFPVGTGTEFVCERPELGDLDGTVGWCAMVTAR